MFTWQNETEPSDLLLKMMMPVNDTVLCAISAVSTVLDCLGMRDMNHK